MKSAQRMQPLGTGESRAPSRSTYVRTVAVFLAWLAAVSSVTAATELKLGLSTGSPGGSATVPVELVSDTEITALQFDLRYPTENLRGLGTLALDANASVSVQSREIEPGVQRVLVYSRNGAALPRALGDVAFELSANAPSAPIALRLSNAIVANGALQKVAPVQLTGGSIAVQPKAEVRIVNIDIHSGGGVAFAVVAPLGRGYAVETSTDLREWNELSRGTGQEVPVPVTDAGLGVSGHRFYRVRLLP